MGLPFSFLANAAPSENDDDEDDDDDEMMFYLPFNINNSSYMETVEEYAVKRHIIMS